MALKVDVIKTLSVKPGSDQVPKKSKADIKRAYRACQEFESILIYRMLSTMRQAFKAKEEDDTSGFGNDIFKSMMDEQLSLALAKSGGLGIANLLARGLGLDDGTLKPDISRVENRSRVIRHLQLTRDGTDGTEKTATGRLSPSDVPLGPYDSTIRAAARVFNLSADLIKAVIMQESGGNRYAVSGKGAKGLMQLTDATAHELGISNPFDPVQNIFGGARLLRRLIDRFKGDLRLALASYNAGLAAVERYGGIPPYKETQTYVEKVLKHLEDLRAAGTGEIGNRPG